MSNKNQSELNSQKDIFEKFRKSLLHIDPVTFSEDYLSLDGKPFRLNGNGFKPFIDMYRYIGLQAIGENSKPVILTKGRQVGATTMGANLECYWCCSKLFGNNGRPPMRIIHAFPQEKLAKTYTKTKLNPTIAQSKLVKDEKSNKMKGIIQTFEAPGVEQSLEFKEFIGGNHIWIESIGVDGDRVRGKTVDCIIYDEVQDMFKTAIFNSKKCLAQSQYGKVGEGIQLYMGTPKSKDSIYFEMWQDSTQNYFFLGCEHCGEYFPLYTPGSNEWESIWLEGYYPKCDHCDKIFIERKSKGFQVRCTKCNHIQDKRDAAERGKWIGKDPAKCKMIGFHINQLFMPRFTRETIISQKPENCVTTDETSWQNEVLGEFYSGTNATISTDEIKDKCGDYQREFRKVILPEECLYDKNVYLGADWGKLVSDGNGDSKSKSGQSYSCIVILKVLGPSLFSIEFATRLEKNDLHYKIEIVKQMMRNYNVKRAVGDIGYAHDLMMELQNLYGDRIVASEVSSGQMHQKVEYKDKEKPTTIRFDKEYFIEQMFDLFRKGAIRFPLGSWEYVAWLIQHCASMVAKPQMDKLGNTKIKYSKGLLPNDGLMALINAFLAYKFDISNGFKNINNAFAEHPQQSSIGLAGGVYLSKMRMTL